MPIFGVLLQVLVQFSTAYHSEAAAVLLADAVGTQRWAQVNRSLAHKPASQKSGHHVPVTMAHDLASLHALGLPVVSSATGEVDNGLQALGARKSRSYHSVCPTGMQSTASSSTAVDGHLPEANALAVDGIPSSCGCAEQSEDMEHVLSCMSAKARSLGRSLTVDLRAGMLLEMLCRDL
ncbi:unnamed protein product [Polarella glacialis]|uniref:Uncharacterized protein n=1 Tax=Polarella glacialis TaxID=89957 RepID=A0A813LG67_POLGL|nr:unnamed protein product [Polarella glacialis]